MHCQAQLHLCKPILVPQVSKGVQGLSRGQRVVSAFTLSCNKCWFCTQRLTCRCSHPDWGARVFGCVPGQAPSDSTAAHPALSSHVCGLAQACTECIAPRLLFCKVPKLLCRASSEAAKLRRWVQDGVGLQGAQAEYVRVPLAEATLVPVPEGVSDEQARPALGLA